MNKLLVALVASTFVFVSASGFAADAPKKKEELTAAQKTEIHDRVERLKSERAKAEQGKAVPAKAAPKATSKVKASNGKAMPKVSGVTVKKAPAKV